MIDTIDKPNGGGDKINALLGLIPNASLWAEAIAVGWKRWLGDYYEMVVL